MAWYEGNTSTYDFPRVLAELMQTTNKADGSPAWELISKNIGETTTKDKYVGEGYVLKSTGKDGKSDILVRILPIIQSVKDDSYWNLGAEIALVGSYTPGLGGLDGSCKDLIPCKLGYNEDTSLYDNYSANGMTKLELIRYWISITEERVIVVAKSRKTVDIATRNFHFICYVGEIESNNSYRVKTCAGTYTQVTLDGATTLALGTTYFAGLGGSNTPYLGAIAMDVSTCNAQDMFYDSVVDVYPLDYKVNTQVIGSLKDMAYRRYYSNAEVGYALPTTGFVELDGVEYLCVMNTHHILGCSTPFSPYTEQHYILVRKG